MLMLFWLALLAAGFGSGEIIAALLLSNAPSIAPVVQTYGDILGGISLFISAIAPAIFEERAQVEQNQLIGGAGFFTGMFGAFAVLGYYVKYGQEILIVPLVIMGVIILLVGVIFSIFIFKNS